MRIRKVSLTDWNFCGIIFFSKILLVQESGLIGRVCCRRFCQLFLHEFVVVLLAEIVRFFVSQQNWRGFNDLKQFETIWKLNNDHLLKVRGSHRKKILSEIEIWDFYIWPNLDKQKVCVKIRNFHSVFFGVEVSGLEWNL